ncbi:MAG: EscN/YscN/HrcN family type III secretion system ATPase, partial [Deltaproteobacteria bacterium]|nr:EscN/YscN/HrcN family type III secretion system ATPase [Deltaproteobacteria bacterium]
VSPEHRKCAVSLRSAVATYKKAYDLISIGAYKGGSDPKVDHAIKVIDRINSFLRQDINEGAGYENCLQTLFGLGA